MYSTKYQLCSGEVLFLSFGGRVTRPDGSSYNYDKDTLINNPEGFVASIGGDSLHKSLCHPEIDIEQVDLMLIGATGFTGKLAAQYMIQKYGQDVNNKFGKDIYINEREKAKKKNIYLGIFHICLYTCIHTHI